MVDKIDSFKHSRYNPDSAHTEFPPDTTSRNLLQDIAYAKSHNAAITATNILVVYDTAQAGATTAANAYQAARAIPAANLHGINITAMLGGTINSSTTKALANNVVSSVINKITAIGSGLIKVILLIGDFPNTISDVASIQHPGNAIGFFDIFMYPTRFLAIGTGNSFDYKYGQAGYWGENANNYAEFPPQNLWWFRFPLLFSVDGYRNINPYMNPSTLNGITTQAEAYAPFNFPLSIFPASNPQSLWLRAIEAENSNANDFGTVLLYPGTGSNPSSRYALEEAFYEGIPCEAWRWNGFEAIFEAVNAFYSGPVYNKDLQNWTKSPGQATFPGNIPNVGLVSIGLNNYYAYPNMPELPGDYNYRPGAIAVCEQSFGATPSTVDWVDPDISLVLTNSLTDYAIYGGLAHPARIDALNSKGSAAGTFFITYNGVVGDNYTITYAGQVITGKIGGVAQFTVDLTGNLTARVAAARISDAIAASGAAFNLLNIDTSGFASRAAQAVRHGASAAIGVTNEPFAPGDATTFGLLTTLWWGYNLAEWNLRLRAGYYVDTPTFVGHNLEYPVNLIIYGDPLMAPFKNRWKSIKYLNKL